MIRASEVDVDSEHMPGVKIKLDTKNLCFITAATVPSAKFANNLDPFFCRGVNRKCNYDNRSLIAPSTCLLHFPPCCWDREPYAIRNMQQEQPSLYKIANNTRFERSDNKNILQDCLLYFSLWFFQKFRSIIRNLENDFSHEKVWTLLIRLGAKFVRRRSCRHKVFEIQSNENNQSCKYFCRSSNASSGSSRRIFSLPEVLSFDPAWSQNSRIFTRRDAPTLKEKMHPIERMIASRLRRWREIMVW